MNRVKRNQAEAWSQGVATATALPPVVRAFDRLSSRYDALCAGEILTGMRRQVHARLAASFAPGSRVLEIGCGTGIDTAFLASRGVQVVACDPSAGMLDRTAHRLRQADGSALLIRSSLEDLEGHLPSHGSQAGSFDGIVSSFGALNCVPRLEALGRLAVARLHARGRLVLGLMTPLCVWEIGYFLVRGKPHAAFRRRRRPPVPVLVDGIEVPTYYHRPAEVMTALGRSFVLQRVQGLGVLVPPPYLESSWRRLPSGLRRALERFDAVVGSAVPFNRAGDHTLLEIERVHGD